jgi:site-specific DNA-methyltransferase (adenine-specific)
MKPAVEVVLVAMCPLSEKTYIDQAMGTGRGVTWLEEGRIPFSGQGDAQVAANKNRHLDFGSGARDNKIYGADTRSRAEQGNYDVAKGRFPANLLVSDDVLNDGREPKVTHFPSSRPKEYMSMGLETGYKEKHWVENGSFSRFFSLDAWWNERIKQLPESVQKTFPWLIVPKASKKEKNKGLDGLPSKFHATMGKGIGVREHDPDDTRAYYRNNHPTVKPIKLMCYLITIGSREGDLILDPYCGTATTGVAAATLNRRFIGFELDDEYAQIARLRYEAAVREIEAEKEESSRQLDWIRGDAPGGEP